MIYDTLRQVAKAAAPAYARFLARGRIKGDDTLLRTYGKFTTPEAVLGILHELAAAQAALSRFEQAALPTEPERLTLTRELASGGVATETVVAAHHYDALRIRLARFESAKMPEDKVCGEFTDFLNEPPQYEDKYMVREYRHQAYPKWMLVYEYIKTLRTLAAAQTVEIESLRAECGLRQIQGYREGKAKAIERCVQLCLLERDKADKMGPRDTPGSTINLDHLMGQGYMANLLAKKLQALKKEG